MWTHSQKLPEITVNIYIHYIHVQKLEIEFLHKYFTNLICTSCTDKNIVEIFNPKIKIIIIVNS